MSLPKDSQLLTYCYSDSILLRIAYLCYPLSLSLILLTLTRPQSSLICLLLNINERDARSVGEIERRKKAGDGWQISLLRRGLFRVPWPCRQFGGWGEGIRKRAGNPSAPSFSPIHLPHPLRSLCGGERWQIAFPKWQKK